MTGYFSAQLGFISKFIPSSVKEGLSKYYFNELGLWFDTHFLRSAAVSFLILYLCTLINTVAGIAATGTASNPVTDLILSNTPRLNTSIIHASLAGFEADLSLLLMVLLPKYLPFTLKAMAGLFLLRAVFINLTNLGTFPDAVPIYSLGTFGGDLFFSGHTASAFLLVLILWDKVPLRWLYVAFTIVFGAGSLLGHYHYSIDVFSAPFFAFGMFAIAKKLFPDDYALTKTKQPLISGSALAFQKTAKAKVAFVLALAALLLHFTSERFVPFAERIASFTPTELVEYKSRPPQNTLIERYLGGE